mgnify:CR=1 FL=1
MKQLFCIILICISAYNVRAFDSNGDSSKKDSLQNQSKTKDTLANGLEDMGFKDLFESNPKVGNPNMPTERHINPLGISYIQDYMDKHQKKLGEMKLWAKPYFDMMDVILRSYGIPTEMKYLAVIESHLNPWAYSWAGAVGPWQFMPGTGRDMGLIVNSYIDERTNYIKSTHAAAKYLKQLYSQLGDWLLVIAAYNGGPGRVYTAISKSGTRNFWNLQQHLPLESRNHVKKFIGTHYVMEGGGGQTTLTAEEWKQHQVNNLIETSGAGEVLDAQTLESTETYAISGRYNSVVVAKKLDLDVKEFNRLNPAFDKMVTTNDGVQIRLPKDKMELFKANQFIVLKESLMSALNNNINAPSKYPVPKKAKK